MDGTIIADNGASVTIIDKAGNISVKSNGLKQEVNGDISVNAKAITEKCESLTVKTDGDVSMTSGGGIFLNGGTGGVKIISGTTLSLISPFSVQIMAPVLRLATFPIISP